MNKNNYRTTIGLESHIQLKTKSKLFSPALNKANCYQNSNVDIVDYGMPGILPVINKKVVIFAIKLGLSLKSTINNKSIFSRKHYFYPDLPKGYQITQFNQPICNGGYIEVDINNNIKSIKIKQIHIEEDAGKSIHIKNKQLSYVDFNRAGTPLLEIVSEPELTSATEAMEFVKALKRIVTYLNICDGNMQDGSLRTDLNISIRKKTDKILGTKVEIKNLNSIKFIGQAINFEIRRQLSLIKIGKKVKQETRLWDSTIKESRPMREKEEAHDYRYLPDPDLSPLIINNKIIQKIKNKLPELPYQKKNRFITKLGINQNNANILTKEKFIADYFESALETHNNAESIANWIINKLLTLKKNNTHDKIDVTQVFPVNPTDLANLIKMIDKKTITINMAKIIFDKLLKNKKISLKKIIEQKNFNIETSKTLLTTLILLIIKKHKKEVIKYKAGKKQLLDFFMGKVMQQSNKNANPKTALYLLKKLLNK